MLRVENYRYVVRGVRERDGARWAIHATDDYFDAELVLQAGAMIDGERWRGVDIYDRNAVLRWVA